MIDIIKASEVEEYFKDKVISESTRHEINEICSRMNKGEKIIAKLTKTQGKEVLKIYTYDNSLYRYYLSLKITIYM